MRLSMSGIGNRPLAALAAACFAAAAVLAAGGAAADSSPLPAGHPTTPTPTCSAGSRPETGIDGQVPVADRVSGRAAQGYSCNLSLVGGVPTPGAISSDSYKNCFYYGGSPGDNGLGQGGVNVIDVSDPAHPVQTDTLHARAFDNAGESLRVDAARGLLVGDHYDIDPTGSAPTRVADDLHALAVYDLSKDCTHPVLLADVIMPHAIGHEGCFQPDGMVYYMSGPTGNITPISLADPRHPTEMTAPWTLTTPHGCGISDDGKTGYFVDTTTGIVSIVDTSQIQANKPDPAHPVIGTYTAHDDLTLQSAIPFTSHGHHYLYAWAESPDVFDTMRACTDAGFSSLWGYLQIVNIDDPAHPVLASRIQTGVDNPANCAAEAADRSPQHRSLAQGDPFIAAIGQLLIYDFHQCTTDRLHDPTILACANFQSGLRVFDVRDVLHPKELAYYSMGTVNTTDLAIDDAAARPVIRRDLGEIWWVTLYGGFHVATFAPGVWPFAGDPRCTTTDYYAAQYDLGYDACLSAKAQGAARKVAAAKPKKTLGRTPTKARTTAAAHAPGGTLAYTGVAGWIGLGGLLLVGAALALVRARSAASRR